VEGWVLVGLGNPGSAYAGHRHNVGAMVVAELARRCRAAMSRHRARALVGQARLGSLDGGAPGPSVVLAQPLTYMNESGGPVAAVLSYFSVGPDRLVVAHDDLDLPFGSVRLKRGGGEGGHNGLRSVSASLGTRDYLRVRVGIGRPPGRMDPADYVLRDFSSRERAELPILVEEAADAVEAVVLRGLTVAQQQFHVPRA
jgi:PTH1 family peptidyl-tRNA hydrolase